MINARAEVKTVVTSQGRFEEHPESYNPRVFVRAYDGKSDVVVYELLKDGQAVVWPTFPQGLDYWAIHAEKVSDIDMVREQEWTNLRNGRCVA